MKCKSMKKTLKLIRNFEKRNNISIAVTFYSDGSSSTEEFWENEKLNESETVKELHQFLINTQYKLDKANGRCISPVQLVSQPINNTICPLCDGKGRRVFSNCTPPINEGCPVCNGTGKVNSEHVMYL